MTEARTWLGVPWQHRGRSRQGLDCVGLLAVISRRLDIQHIDDIDYGHYPDFRKLIAILLLSMDEVNRDTMKAGDVLLLRDRNDPQHTAIYTSQQTIIHAGAGFRKVVEHGFTPEWQAKLVKVFRLKGLT